MDDPIPEKYITLPEAVQTLSGKIADRSIEITRRDLQLISEIFGVSSAELDLTKPRPKPDEAQRQWAKRELAIREIYVALVQGGLTAFIRNATSGELFRLTPDDWRFAKFWDHTIRGGVIHAVAGESIWRHDGLRVLVDDATFRRWLTPQRYQKFAGGFSDFSALLEREMLASPNQKTKPKPEWQRISKHLFGVPRREFHTIWRAAITNTGANWDHPGAPRKSAQ